MSSSAHLNLWKQQLGAVPESVWERTDLETLVLADTGLTEVSSRIGGLKKLRMLDLGHNQLTRVPDAIGDLDALTNFLYLHDNRLTDLPPALARLTRLRYLNISDNRFTTFPDSVCAMAGLRDNRLAVLPAAIGSLRDLRQLDLRGNPVTALPDEVAMLPRLEKLDLRWVTTLSPPRWIKDIEARGCVVYR
ncbi:MAG: leucine-rich repeat domain-containing protein [Acidobacteria bacterium]|nr:leucine-rich repeat domain-containing protein [Acidobacteriota bacterium]